MKSPVDPKRLLEWGRINSRRYEWRTTDRYSMAVAEVLLQKTRGAAAAPVFRSLVKRYRTPESLANAPVDEIRELVAPLGLGSQRAKRLNAMARGWIADPRIKLTGVGSYGTGILSLAAGIRPEEPPVDGNIARVYSRFLGLTFSRGEPRKKKQVKEAVASAIDKMQPLRSLEFVYALVDLGAAICVPRQPRCSECPLGMSCEYKLAEMNGGKKQAS